MISSFIEQLRRLDKKITAAEIADILWLAVAIDGVVDEGEQKPVSTYVDHPKNASSPSDVDNESSGNKGQGSSQEDNKKTVPSEASKEKEVKEEPSSQFENEKTAAPLYTRPQGTTSPGVSGCYPIALPGVPALPDRLNIMRALRPLKRWVDSRCFSKLDVQATVERIAETRSWWPVTRPSPEPWLDLVVVIEESPSMRVWRPVVRELYRLFQGSGIFRRVTERRVRLNHAEKVTGFGAEGSSGRCLVLVVSDAVSHAWWSGKAADILKCWGRDAMIALVQMFPEHLWDRTGLGRAEKIRISPVVA